MRTRSRPNPDLLVGTYREQYVAVSVFAIFAIAPTDAIYCTGVGQVREVKSGIFNSKRLSPPNLYQWIVKPDRGDEVGIW